MTYDEFERIGLDEGMPYAFCKIAFHAMPWSSAPFDEQKLRRVCRQMIADLPVKGLEALREISKQEFTTGALEAFASSMMKRHLAEEVKEK